jgi:phosphoenolpyruvate carboxylase
MSVKPLEKKVHRKKAYTSSVSMTAKMKICQEKIQEEKTFKLADYMLEDLLDIMETYKIIKRKIK